MHGLAEREDLVRHQLLNQSGRGSEQAREKEREREMASVQSC